MSDYELAIKYLKACFDQAVRLSENDRIYNDTDRESFPVSEIDDFLKSLKVKS